MRFSLRDSFIKCVHSEFFFRKRSILTRILLDFPSNVTRWLLSLIVVYIFVILCVWGDILMTDVNIQHHICDLYNDYRFSHIIIIYTIHYKEMWCLLARERKYYFLPEMMGVTFFDIVSAYIFSIFEFIIFFRNSK